MTVGRHYALAAISVAALVGTLAGPARPAPQSAPSTFQGFAPSRDQPVKIESSRLEVRDKDRMAKFLGDVKVVQGDTTLTCQTLLVYYEQGGAAGTAPPDGKPPATGNGPQQIRRLEASGDVVVAQKDQIATGSSGVYDMKTNTITLTGNVVVTQGQNVLRGERLVVDMTTGVSRVEPGKSAGGRVEGLFLPGGVKEPPSALGAPKDPPKPPATDPLKLR